MKKAVTLAAIAGLSLASDFQDTELVAHLSSKPTVRGGSGNKIFFDDDEFYGESRSKLTIFDKKKRETNEKTEHDDELMTVLEFLKAQPQLVSIPERQILDVRTRVPVVSVLPAAQPKTEEEDNKPKERSNFSIFDRKEGEKTDEKNHHGKSATRSNFSILNRKHVTSNDVQHAKRDLEALVSELLRHKYVKSGNEFFGLRDLKKGGDRDSNKANVLKLDSEDTELYGIRDWRRGDKDSGKAGVLGLDDEGDDEFRVLGNLIYDGLEIYRDVKNKDYGSVVNHGVKAARDVHELTKKRNNFLGN